MSVLNQIEQSQLSKKGQTNPSGIFEGTPANVAAVVRGGDTPRVTSVIPAIQNPIDVTYNSKPQPTYLNYIKATTGR